MASDDFPAPSEGFVLTYFIVASDVARSRDFYVGVLGGTWCWKASRRSSSWPTAG
jgi:hypothetical protein